MRKTIFLISLVALLAGCAGGGSGKDSYKGVETHEPSVSCYITGECDSEKVFGAGQGLYSTPTDLLTQFDDKGNEYFTFGGWGNVYDIRLVSNYLGGMKYEFTPEQRKNFGFSNGIASKYDAPNEYMRFVGAAVMEKYDDWYTGKVVDTDYGTVELRMNGTDDEVPYIKFDMHNDVNDITMIPPHGWGNTGYDEYKKGDAAVSITSDLQHAYVHVFYHDGKSSSGERRYTGYADRR